MLEQVKATVDAINVPRDHEIGWIDEKTVADTLQLLASVGEIDQPRAPSAYFTNALLAAGIAFVSPFLRLNSPANVIII